MRPALVGALVFGVLVVPLFIALGVLRHPRWYPLLDMAQTELRVRDVWSSHPPLIGLAGRIGPFGNQGSHPGPLSFWALWPFYQLFGASSWALHAAAVTLQAAAIGAALWIARRRGGVTLMLAIGVVLAILLHAYGASLLTQAWNPYLPVLCWLVFLLAVWSVVAGDLPMLPVAVLSGFFCMQTHVSYLGLVSGLGVVMLAAVAYQWYLHRADPERRRTVVRWLLVSVGLAALVWAPPVIDQWIHDPGNFSVLWDHFTDPPERPIGASEGVRVFLGELNPWSLLTRSGVGEHNAGGTGGSVLPGIALVAAWLVSVVAAWRMRNRPLLCLDIVLGSALVFGAISSARIFGFVWYYLLLWAWSITALLVVAIVWTAVRLLAPRVRPAQRARDARLGRIALASAVVVVSGIFAIDAAEVELPSPRATEAVGALVEPTARALEERPDDAPYLVTWLGDPFAIGAQGYALLNELERKGLDVRASDVHRAGATPYRVIKPREASLEAHIAIGSDIDRWREQPGFEEVAFHDTRSARERSDFARLRRQVIAGLESAGLSEKVDEVDTNLFFLGLDEDVPKRIREMVADMHELGLPGAVFVGRPTGGA